MFLFFSWNGIPFVCSAVSFFSSKFSFSLLFEIGIVHGHCVCECLCVVYLKAHLLAVILRLELDFGAMCIVHAFSLPYNSIPRMIFLLLFLFVIISFWLAVHVIIIFRLLLLLLSLFIRRERYIPKVELKCEPVCLCVWNKIRESEKWNRLHRECSGYRELVLVLLQQKQWNVFIIMGRLKCAAAVVDAKYY